MNAAQSVKYWLLAIRPKTLSMAAVPVLVGTTLGALEAGGAPDARTGFVSLVGAGPGGLSAAYYLALKASDELGNVSALGNVLQVTTETPPPQLSTGTR